MAEAARLAAVAVDGERLARERLADQARHDHAVAAGLARPDRVEEARDGDRQVALAPVGHRQKLVDRLRAGVGPASPEGGAELQVAVLFEGQRLALAVHLARGGQQHRLAVPVGVLEHDLGAVHVGLDSSHRALDHEAHAHGGGEVDHDVGVGNKL